MNGFCYGPARSTRDTPGHATSLREGFDSTKAVENTHLEREKAVNEEATRLSINWFVRETPASW